MTLKCRNHISTEIKLAVWISEPLNNRCKIDVPRRLNPLGLALSANCRLEFFLHLFIAISNFTHCIGFPNDGVDFGFAERL